MSQPIDTAYVEVRPDLKSFAARLNAQLTRALKSVEKDLNRSLADALSKTRTNIPPVDVPLKPKTDDIPRKLPKKTPPVPVPLDPLFNQLRTDLQRQTAALSKQFDVKVPATAQTERLRNEMTAQIAALQQRLKVQVPAEAGDRRRLELELKAMVAELEHRVKLQVPVTANADPLKTAVTGALSSVSQTLSGGLSNLGSGVTNLSTNLFNLAAAVLAAVAAMSVAVPAVYALGGALAAIPAVSVGLGAAVGTLALGFHGLADAFGKSTKAAGGSGGAVADTGHQVAAANRAVTSAERQLAAAQRTSREAQQALTDARTAYVQRVLEVGRSLRGARLDEEAATNDQADALAKLNALRQQEAEAPDTVDPKEIRDAALAYRQSNQTLDEAKARTQELAAEQDKARKTGFKGSQEYAAALKQQQSAADGLASAQESLTSAQESLAQAQQKVGASGGAAAGGVDKVAEAMRKLAPSARETVLAIKGLAPAFDRLRRNVQERLFSGVGPEIQRIAKVWLPALEFALGQMATTFNRIFKDLAKAVSKPEFVANILIGIESVRRLIERVGKAITGPLVEAFGTLAANAGPFIDALAEGLTRVIERFSAWIKTAAKSGALQDFMQKAADTLRDIFAIAGSVASILGSLFSIIVGGTGHEGQSPLDGLRSGLDDLDKWLKDPKHQKQVQDFLRKIQDLVDWIATEAIPKIQGWMNKIDGWVQAIQGWVQAMRDFRAAAAGAIAGVGAVFGGLPGGILLSLANLPGMLTAIAKGAVTGLITGITTGIPSILAVFRAVVLAAVNAVKSLLGIKSPSTVFASIGSNIMAGLRNGIVSAAGSVGSAITSAISNYVVGPFSGVAKRIARVTSGMWDGIKSAFRSAINWVIDAWNNLEFPGIKVAGVQISPGFGTPNISRLATGGMTTKPTFAQLSETGQKEVVVPVENPRTMAALRHGLGLDGGITGAGANVTVNLNVTAMPGADAQRFATELSGYIETIVRKALRGQAQQLAAQPRTV